MGQEGRTRDLAEDPGAGDLALDEGQLIGLRVRRHREDLDQRVVERDSRRDSISKDEIGNREQEMREAEQHGREIEARNTPFGKRLLVAAVGLPHVEAHRVGEDILVDASDPEPFAEQTIQVTGDEASQVVRMSTRPGEEGDFDFVIQVEPQPRELRHVIPAFLARIDQPDRGGRWIDYFAETRRAFDAVAAPLVDDEIAEPRDEVTLTDSKGKTFPAKKVSVTVHPGIFTACRAAATWLIIRKFNALKSP